jgi:hypothetical protein
MRNVVRGKVTTTVSCNDRGWISQERRLLGGFAEEKKVGT